jgi:eukaryotic-like serine/threonine-protein kinase
MLSRLIIDIHRRSLWQVLTIYLIGAWVALQVVGAVTDSAGLPDWVPGLALVLLVIGLPIVLATAFVQEGMPGAAAAPPSPHQPQSTPPPESPAAGSVPLDLPAVAPAMGHRLFTWRNAILGGVVAFALLGVVAAGYMGMRTLGLGSPGTLLAQGVLEQGAPVVLADFDGGGDPELGAVVTRALRIDLMQSPAIRVLERADLGPALGRMQLDARTSVTAAVATELAEREGYAAVIVGDVAPAGSGYVLTASILAGAGFRSVAGFRETARSDDDLVDAIERLSHSMRNKVGESLRTVRSGPSLEQVSTSSLPALRAYTRGVELQGAGDMAGSLGEMERAVALDSTFAMAYRGISANLNNLGVRRADAVRATRRAWELRDRLPELERHLATGNYHDRVTGDMDAAARAYELALVVDSTRSSTRNSLANVYALMGRFTEAEQLYAGPLRVRAIAALWANLAVVRYRMGDIDGAVATADSMHAALPDWAYAYHLQVELATARFDYARADSLTGLLEADARTAFDREYARLDRFLLAAMRGRLREAQRVLTAPGAELFLAEPLNVAGHMGSVLLLRGDTAAAVRHMQDAVATQPDAFTSSGFSSLIAVLAESGAIGPAADMLAAWQAAVRADELGTHGRTARDYSVGQIARLQRDFDTALGTLSALRSRCPGCRASISYEIARTYDDMGQADRAISAYEHSLEHPDPYRLLDIITIPHALRRLAELYDDRGDEAKAMEYYARFIDLRSGADRELQPSLRRAQDRVTALLARKS